MHIEPVLADFKGVKMRAPDGIPAEIFSKLGASVSVIVVSSSSLLISSPFA